MQKKSVKKIDIIPCRVDNMDRKITKKAVHITLIILIFIVIISGLGITYYKSIELVTGGLLDKTLSFELHGGLLDKTLSFELHTLLFLPFLLILLIHIFFSWLWPKKD